MAAEPINISSSATATQQPPASSHRLPTQSAAAALEGLQNGGKSAVPSGLSSLDAALIRDGQSSKKGFERGKIAEIWGPSGAGKSTVAFQAAKEAMQEDSLVVWLAAATPLSGSRLRSLDDAVAKDNFRYLSIATLTHLLAMILHSPPNFPPDNTSLLVVDDLNSLVDLQYPRLPFTAGNKNEQQKWQAGRRYAILGSIVSALSKLAVLHNMAVIVSTGCSSRMRAENGLPASLAPGIGGSEWEAGIWSRIVAFKDLNGRFLGVQKCQGRNVMPLDPVGDVRNAIGFEIGRDGSLMEHVIDLMSSSSIEVPTRPLKPAHSPAKLIRKRTYDEVADSEDEEADEYGWAEGDEDTVGAGVLKDDNKATVPSIQDAKVYLRGLDT